MTVVTAANTPRTYAVHAITRSWKQGTGAAGSGATWNTSDGTTAWATAGGDYVATPTASTQTGAKGAVLHWDVTSDVGAFVAGVRANYGWIVKDSATSGNIEYDFASENNATVARRPQLVVTYNDCAAATPTIARTSTATVMPTSTPTFTPTPALTNIATATKTSTPGDTVPPSVPTITSAAASSCSRIDLTWAPSNDTGGSGLKGYNVYRNGVFLTQVLAPGTTTSDANINGSTIYRYAISAIDNAGNASAQSVTASVNTPACGTPTPTSTATPAATVIPKLIGFVQGVGTATDVRVDPATGMAYVATSAFGLSVVNVADPSLPYVLSGMNPAFAGSRVALAGSLAVVVSGTAGMTTIDISTPALPTALGSLSLANTGIQQVDIAGQYAYVLLNVAGNPGYVDLGVVDVHLPQTPTLIGRVTVAGLGAVRVAGRYAYVAAANGGLQIVDVGNPAAPVIVSTLATLGSAKDLAVANGYAYIAATSDVQIIDVHVATSPVSVGSLSTPAVAAAVSGNRLCVLDGSTLKVIDITNPSAPALLGSTASYAQGIAVTNNVAYLASSSPAKGDAGLFTVDISVPAAPVVLANADGRFDDLGISTAGNLATLAGGALGMQVLDVTDPANPLPVGSLSLPNTTFQKVAMSGPNAYVVLSIAGNPGHCDLAVVDLQVPSVPTIVGRVTVAGNGGVRVVGSLAYVAATSGGLQIVDVSNPAAPTIISTLAIPGSAKGVVVAGGYAYVAANTSVQVVDVRAPTNPVIVGSLATTAVAAAISGNRLIVIDGSTIKIIDVSTPAVPVLLSSTPNYGAQDVDASGTLAFLAGPTTDHSGGVFILDISNPAMPTLLQHITVAGLTRTLTWDGVNRLLYAGDAAALIDIIQVP